MTQTTDSQWPTWATDGLGKLDQRLMALADQMEASGATDEADRIRIGCTFIREAWDGGDSHLPLPEALERISEHAKGMLQVVADLFPRPVPRTDRGQPVTGPGERTSGSLDLVREHGIDPGECGNCGSETNWGQPTFDGTTAATDDGDVVWECKGCGQHTAMTAEGIRAAAERAE